MQELSFLEQVLKFSLESSCSIALRLRDAFRMDTIHCAERPGCDSLAEVGVMSWDRHLIRPVKTPKGKLLVTLSDARTYALALPKSQQDMPHVKAGIGALLHAANGEVCEFVAQVAVAAQK